MNKQIIVKIQQISLKYDKSVLVGVRDVIEPTSRTTDLVHAFNRSMMNLGFVMSRELHTALVTQREERIKEIHDLIMPILSFMKGADVVHKPMYPNFPQQVKEASDLELYTNAILHYWTHGQWLPEYEEKAREHSLEVNKFISIGVINNEGLKNIFVKLLSSNDSLSQTDKETVEWFIKNVSNLRYPEKVPFKETLCLVAGLLLQMKKDIKHLVTNSTDVLRIATYLSDGDVSLAENTKFRNIPRRYRKKLCEALENVISEEDIARHKNKWLKLFHFFHVGANKKNLKTKSIAHKLRNGKKLETFNSQVESALQGNEFITASALLSQRPGDFCRRLDHLLRKSTGNKIKPDFILTDFANSLEKKGNNVSTRVLLQLYGNMKDRLVEIPNKSRIIFPKGASAQKAFKLPEKKDNINKKNIVRTIEIIEEELFNRFSKLEGLGSVYIDPALMNCPLPSAQRSASEGLKTIARGSRIPLEGDKGTIRLFIYWVGRDIDLSVTLHDENFKQIDHASYTNLRSDGSGVYHSGDITSAPDGASEFIDADIQKMLDNGVRYLAMNVLVYSGPNFDEHSTCYAGWMLREQPNSGEIYDPTTVYQKADLTSQSRNAIPVLFDLETREAIWTDLTTNTRTSYWGNNVESNRASIEQVLTAMANMSKVKTSLYDLFVLHGLARGQLVQNKEEADTIFGMEEGITPYDILDINSQFIE